MSSNFQTRFSFFSSLYSYLPVGPVLINKIPVILHCSPFLVVSFYQSDAKLLNTVKLHSAAAEKGIKCSFAGSQRIRTGATGNVKAVRGVPTFQINQSVSRYIMDYSSPIEMENLLVEKQRKQFSSCFPFSCLYCI